MTQKFLCLSVAVALLCGLATTNVVNADEAALNDAVVKIEAVGKMIADLKLAAANADNAAESAGAVLAGAVRTAVVPTRGALPYRYAHPAYGPAPYPVPVAYPRYPAAYPYYYPYYPPSAYYRVGLFGCVRAVAPYPYPYPYPYHPGYGPYYPGYGSYYPGYSWGW